MMKPIKPPMSDIEFHNYLDSAGVMIQPSEFRLSVYQGGIEPSLRRVAWRHLLNIYPAYMSGQDRFNYLKQKEQEYRKLRDEWHERFRNNTAMEEVKYVASMVKKDVLRTDRSHEFYAGSDENENIISLFNILVTYALTHPDVSYCQGMGDLASPLLVTQKDEAQAYICFCALMNRLRENFSPEGCTIMTRFNHLSELLKMYDPVLYSYMVQNSAEDMFFCYRWFLLELKREFPFSDALCVLEVMWATLPHSPPQFELALVDSDYSSRLLASSPCSPTSSLQHAMYAKLLTMRRVGAHYRVTQPAASFDSSGQASTSNNLSTEPSLFNNNLYTDQNTFNNTSPSTDQNTFNTSPSTDQNTFDISSSTDLNTFDTSPGDEEADFPEIDNHVTRCMQQKLNSITQVLHEGSPVEKNVQEEHPAGDIGEAFHCNCEIGTSDSSGAFTDSNNSSEMRNGVLQPKQENISNHMDVDDDNGRVSLSCNLNAGRNWSENSLVSECSDQQTQFSLSLDSNSNNWTEVSHVAFQPKSFVSCTDARDSDSGRINVKFESQSVMDNTGSVKSEAQNVDCTRAETSQNLFRDMKHLLVSPKRQSLNSCWQDTPVLPKRPSSCVNRQANFVLSQGLKNAEKLSDSHISDCQEATEAFGNSGSVSSSSASPPIRDPSKLPPPQEFGAGNPFLMFVSLTLLTEHRETIFNQAMCYEEIAMHFDRLVRKHNANRVLYMAKHMYTEYLRAQQAKVEIDADELDFSYQDDVS